MVSECYAESNAVQRHSLMEAEMTLKCAVDVAISKVTERYNIS